MPKKPSIIDVAREANLSVGTVSNYLNQTVNVRPQTQRRIQEAIEKLGYQRNELARGLRSSRTRTIGMIVNNVLDPHVSNVFMGAHEEALLKEQVIILGHGGTDGEYFDQYLEMFLNKQVDGLIIQGPSSSLDENKLRDINVPLVMVEYPGHCPGFPTVSIDNQQAAFEITEHLIRLGHERIAFVGLRDRLRLVGYRVALEAYSIPFSDTLVYPLQKYAIDKVPQGIEAIQTLLKQSDFTACFCDTDLLAIGALHELKRQRFQIPQDIAVAGFDDIPVASLVSPSLTTVSQPTIDMGREAVDLLDRLLETDNHVNPHVKLSHRLMTRGSTVVTDNLSL